MCSWWSEILLWYLQKAFHSKGSASCYICKVFMMEWNTPVIFAKSCSWWSEILLRYLQKAFHSKGTYSKCSPLVTYAHMKSVQCSWFGFSLKRVASWIWKVFSCDICKKLFTQKSNLLLHMQSVSWWSGILLWYLQKAFHSKE